MLKKHFFLFLFALSALQAKAQAPPYCPLGEPPADDCLNVCICCNLHGYMGNTSGYTAGSAPGFCGAVENDQWLGFIAGASSATFTVTSSNCLNGNGIQLAIYEDCQEDPIANGCNGGNAGSANIPLSVHVALTPGTHYYLMIDGYAGDLCDFSIGVNPPNAVQTQPLGNSIGPIQGPAALCPGGSTVFSVPPVTNAGDYTWTVSPGWLVNGQPGPVSVAAPEGTQVTITAGPDVGNAFQVCVEATNSCTPNGPSACHLVQVQSIATTTLPAANICFEEAPYILPWGSEAPSTGNYQVTLSSFLGCDSLVQQFVQVKPLLVTHLPAQTICAGECISVCGDDYCSSGNYQVVCQSFQGCDSIINFALQVLEPVAIINGSGTLTCNQASVVLSASPTPASTILNWRNLAGQLLGTAPAYTVTTPGTYLLTATMNGNGVQCAVADTVVIVADTTPPTLTATGGNLTCALDSVVLNTLTNAQTPSWIWSGPNSFSSVNASPTVYESGTYMVTITNGTNGCTATATASVSLDNTPPGATAGVTGVISCLTPGVTLLGGPDSLGNTFAWSGPGGFSSSLQNPAVDTAGVYTLVVMGSNGCSTTATTSVLGNTLVPDAAAQGGTVSCGTPVVTINGISSSNSPIFVWQGPNGYVSMVQNPNDVTEPGLYTLTVTTSNHCSATATATVVGDFATPDLTATGATLDCNHPQVGISATSSLGQSYAWFGPNNFISNLQNPLVDTNGVYSVTVTSANGCSSSDNVSVLLDASTASLVASAFDFLTCSAPSINIQTMIGTPHSALDSIRWSGPNGFFANITSPSVSEPGIYTLVATTLNGCTSSIQVMVNQNIATPNIVAAGGTLNCALDSLALNGGSTTPGVVFTWTGPDNFSSNEQDPIVSEHGTYTLTVTGSSNGCTASLSASVLLDTLPPGATALSANPLDCDDFASTLTVSTQTGVGFAWSGPNNFSANTPQVSASLPGDYQVIVTGPNACVSSAAVTVLQDISPPMAVATGDTIDCISGEAMLSGHSATPNVTFTWSGPNNFSSTQQNPMATTDGEYILTVTGPNACTNTATANVSGNTLSPQVTIAGGGTVTCLSPEISLWAEILTIGATGIWTGPNNFISDQDSITVSEPGTYTYTVVAPNACVSAPSVTVSQHTQPPQDVVANGGLLNCNFPSIALAAQSSTPGVAYWWTGPGNFSSTLPNPSVSNPGTYSVTITDPSNGCTATATAVVTQDPNAPSVLATADSLTCSQTSVVLNAASSLTGLEFVWTGPNGFMVQEEDPTTTTPGVYQVVATDVSSGCSATFQLFVIQNINPPALSAQGDTLACNAVFGQIFSNSTDSEVSFAWSGPAGFSSQLPNPDVTLHGTYTVVATGSNGCSTSAEAVVLPAPNAAFVTAIGGTITCTNPSVMLSAEANIGVSWAWSGPGNFSSNIANPLITVPGNYAVEATTPEGCVSTLGVVVQSDTQSPQVLIQVPNLLTCTTAQVGLNATVMGQGTWEFQWNTNDGNIVSGANGLTPTVNRGGNYHLLVTNLINGCTTLETVVVVADDDTPQANHITEMGVKCFGDTNGSASIGEVTGGTPPYLYSLDNQTFVSENIFTALAPGTHTLVVQDVNGCEYETSFDIAEPEALVVNLGLDTTIHLGDEVLFSLENTVNFPDKVAQTLLTPADLPMDSSYVPVHSFRYRVTVLDSNGCRATDERLVVVDWSRWVYVPNVFKPGTSENNKLTVYGGPDVARIRSFRIFDRWGELVHEAKDFAQNDWDKGWDGTLRGQALSPAVFVYYAEISFKDGETILFKGDLTLVR